MIQKSYLCQFTTEHLKELPHPFPSLHPDSLVTAVLSTGGNTLQSHLVMSQHPLPDTGHRTTLPIPSFPCPEEAPSCGLSRSNSLKGPNG